VKQSITIVLTYIISINYTINRRELGVLATTNLNIRIDADLKKQSESILNELGLTMSTALTVFLRQTVRSNGIPFEMRLNTPNDDTLAAIQDVNINRNMSKPFHSVKELMEDLDA
jgi:DNA-damage-inducible protein J